MPTDSTTHEQIPSWLPHGVLFAICADAAENDSTQAARYADIGLQRVRDAIDRGDAILRAFHRHDDDDAIDVALSRAALLIARGMIRPLEEPNDD